MRLTGRQCDQKLSVGDQKFRTGRQQATNLFSPRHLKFQGKWAFFKRKHKAAVDNCCKTKRRSYDHHIYPAPYCFSGFSQFWYRGRKRDVAKNRDESWQIKRQPKHARSINLLILYLNTSNKTRVPKVWPLLTNEQSIVQSLSNQKQSRAAYELTSPCLRWKIWFAFQQRGLQQPNLTPHLASINGWQGTGMQAKGWGGHISRGLHWSEADPWNSVSQRGYQLTVTCRFYIS